MEGFGEEAFNNRVDSINKARKTKPANLLYALGIPGIGITTAKPLAITLALLFHIDADLEEPKRLSNFRCCRIKINPIPSKFITTIGRINPQGCICLVELGFPCYNRLTVHDVDPRLKL